LVDSGTSISILPHSSSAPSTGPHLVGANGKLVSAWGRRCQTVCFAGHNFEFDFFLAAVATPIIGMDFLAKFELSIIPAKQQVLHTASGRTFTKASTSFFVSPWSPETAAAIAALPPQVQKLLEEFPSLLRPSAAPPKPLHGVVHHIDTGSVAPVLARPRRLDPEKHRIAEEEFLALEKAGIIRCSNSPWASPLHLVPKNGSWCPCSDYRRLNANHHTQQVPPPKHAVSQ
jgi:hypothetical protein